MKTQKRFAISEIINFKNKGEKMMKLKLTIFFVTAVVAMGLLLGSGTARAAADVQFDPIVAGKAIGITGLDIGGTLYDVEFLESTTAHEVYGETPGDFDFDTAGSAGAAVDAVNFALSSANAVSVGQVGGSNLPRNRLYAVGYDSVGPLASVSRGVSSDPWLRPEDSSAEYCCETLTYATFSVGANEVHIGGSVSHLEGSGLQLQNNGGDTLDISGNGPFVFSETILTGDTYNVTVLTNPSNPDQQCTVARGSGTASTEDVTNVVVSCVPFEPLTVVRVFVTKSDAYDGNLGGLDGADAECQAAADAAQLGGGPWTAWISDDTEDAIDRIPNGRYRLLDDTLIALDKDDLTTQKALSGDYLRNGIDINEFGEEDPGGYAWTGTGSDGTAAGNNCENWTVNTGVSVVGTAGDVDRADSTWTSGPAQLCNTLNRLYCFSVPAPAAAPTAAFLPAIYLLLLLDD